MTLPILMYHSFNEISVSGLQDLGVPQKMFREQVQALLNDGFEVRSVGEAMRALEERPTGKVVAVTIDDGYVDSLDGAEILNDLGASATVYIPTASVGQPTAAYLRSKATAVPRPVTWSEVGELAGLGMEIGSHSHNHLPLDVLPAGRARAEMVASRQILEAATGASVRSFCYPNGYSSRRTRRLVAEAGYDNACSIGHRVGQPATDDPYSLPRLLVRPEFTGRDVVNIVSHTGRQRVAGLKSSVERPWRWVRKGVWEICRYPLT
jgi:peptidoglycan/xylan/chitin deacetylase (PgdA/CDA1 family)